MRADGIPRTAWLAVGVAAGATAAAMAAGPLPTLAAGLLLLALAAAPPPGRPAAVGGMGNAATAAGVGALLVALRLVVGPPGSAVPTLDAAGSPSWTADVVSVGSPKDGSQLVRLAIRTGGEPVVVAATLPAFPLVPGGAVVEVDGRLEPPPDDDPYGEYLRRTGASGSLRATSVRVVRAPPWPSVQALRDGAGDALRLSLPEPEAGLAAGILIGLRERVDRGLAADFATAGVSHVVAISGWNIAIVATLVAAMLRGRSRRTAGLVTGGVIVAYVIAAGASPSVVRAAVMAGVVLLARGSGRAVRAPAALSLAAAGLLLLDPGLVGDAGFRLSVLATAGLLAWATPLGAWLGGVWGGRLPGWLAEGLGITLAAQAATLPDVLATFGRLSLVAPAVNLAVVPIVPAAMAGGALALVGGWLVQLGVPGPLGVVAGLPGWLLLRTIVTTVRFAAGLPFAAIALPPGLAIPAAIGALVLVASVLLAIHRRRRAGQRARAARPGAPRPAGRAAARPSGHGRRGPRIRPPTRLERLALAGSALIVAVTLLAAADVVGRADRIVVLDVGQGDAILVESRDGARMLVDGGPDPDRVLAELDAILPPWDRRVDIVVLTHPHEDHVAGLVRVLERYRVGRVFEPGMRGAGPGWQAWDRALGHGPPRGTLATGARLRLGDISLDVLWPRPGTVPTAPASTGTGVNNTSIVLLGTASGRHFLLMGDAEQGVDPELVAGGLPRLDVLKVAHHGSATATTAALLEATRPALALISVGAGNDFGHPAPSTLARLRGAGARVVRTDDDGRIEALLRPDGVDVRTAGARRTAATPDSGYDRSHDRSGAPRGRPPAALARSARLGPASRLRRGRRRGVARRARVGARCAPRPARRRYRSAAARRGQAAGVGRGPSAAPRRGVRGLAHGERARRAGAARPRPPGDVPRGRRARCAPGGRPAGGSSRRLRGQARGPAARIDGRALPVLEAAIPVGSGRVRPASRRHDQRRSHRRRLGR